MGELLVTTPVQTVNNQDMNYMRQVQTTIFSLQMGHVKLTKDH